MIYPLVREMAAPGARVRVPVAVTCRVLGFSEQAYYRWLKRLFCKLFIGWSGTGWQDGCYLFGGCGSRLF